MARSRFLWGLLIASMAGILAASGWSWFSIRSTILPTYGQVPPFQLTDEAQRPFDSQLLRGKIWVVDFIFTSCAGSCPQLTSQMVKLERQLPSSIHFVSISVDPARDTPPVLARYARDSGANLTHWSFLTGSAEEIERVVKEGFHLALADGEGPSEVTHSVRFVLVDRQGFIRGAYDGTDPKAVTQLTQDAKGLLKGS